MTCLGRVHGSRGIPRAVSCQPSEKGWAVSPFLHSPSRNRGNCCCQPPSRAQGSRGIARRLGDLHEGRVNPGPSWMLAEPQKQLAGTVLLLDRSLGRAPRFWNMEQDLLLALRTLKSVGSWPEWPAVTEVQGGHGDSFPSHHLV